MGLAFLVVGGLDFVLAWVPPMVGSSEWAFGTATASFNGLPIVAMGVVLLGASAIRVERRWWSVVATAAAAVLFVWVLVGAVLWANSVSTALASVPAELSTGVKRAVLKTGVQSLTYLGLFGYLARAGVRVSKSLRE
jgi:hypothetical protein